MEILILLIFVSGCLVALALTFFVWIVRENTLDHTDRLALLPLESDAPSLAKGPSDGSQPEPEREA